MYGIFTNGGYSGIAGGQMKKIIRQKGLSFKGYAEFKLASNHITNKNHVLYAKIILDEEGVPK